MVGRPPDPVLRKAREDAVLLAAMNLFAERGVRQTTMKDICEAADTSPGALYRYFSSKEDIILAIADLDAQRINKLVTTIDAENDLLTTLEEWSDHILAARTDNLSARLRVEFTAEALRSPDVAEAFTKADDELRTCLERAIRRDTFAGKIIVGFEPASLAYLLQSLLDGVSSRAAFGQNVDNTALRENLCMFLGGLRAVEPLGQTKK